MTENRALTNFIQELGEEYVFGQVLIRRSSVGFEVRHVEDRSLDTSSLRLVTLAELRALAERNAVGEFRPLRSSPDLQRGWHHVARGAGDLNEALDRIYPGGLADWYAARLPNPPVTHYRAFTNRQSGMYRITQLLTDTQAGNMISACCAPDFCIKHRHWTVEGFPPDRGSDKSNVPCLEPCAILLEFARKALRLEQEVKTSVDLTGSDLETLEKSLEIASRSVETGIRVADFGSPLNPRRMRLLAKKLAEIPKPPPVP